MVSPDPDEELSSGQLGLCCPAALGGSLVAAVSAVGEWPFVFVEVAKRVGLWLNHLCEKKYQKTIKS